jgi:hypothetical protein
MDTLLGDVATALRAQGCIVIEPGGSTDNLVAALSGAGYMVIPPPQ